MLGVVLSALFLINAVTVFRFWEDKMRAIHGTHRIPEANLLGLAIMGGSPGAFLGRHMFRHKTRKEPFSTYLKIIPVQVGALVAAWLA